MIELAVVEGQALGGRLPHSIRPASAGSRATSSSGPGEHLRALVHADDAAPAGPHERARHQPRAGRHVENAVVGPWADGADERAPPARVLPEAERSAEGVVVPGQAREELEGVLLAGRDDTGRRLWHVRPM